MMRRGCTLTVAMALAVVSCETGESPAPRVVLDTLPNGAVRVVNEGLGFRGVDSTVALRETRRIGTAGTGPSSFSRITSIVVDQAGRIYVLDEPDAEVRVFDPRGRYLRTIGRKGGGPGEFGGPVGLAVGEHGRLWVSDLGNQRYTAFDSTGSVVEEHPRGVTGRSSPRRLGFVSDGHLLEGGAGIWGRVSSQTVFRLGADFRKVDSLRVGPSLEEVQKTRFDLPPGAPLVVRIPFSERIVWDIDPDGSIWLAGSRSYALLKLTVGGDTLRLVTRDIAAPTVASAEVAAVLPRLDSLTDGAASRQRNRIPDSKPFLRSITISRDGHLWAERFLGADEAEFDIFAPEGRYLGSARAPIRLQEPFFITGSRMYAVTTDELDVPYVVVLDVRQPRQ